MRHSELDRSSRLTRGPWRANQRKPFHRSVYLQRRDTLLLFLSAILHAYNLTRNDTERSHAVYSVQVIKGVALYRSTPPYYRCVGLRAF